MKLFIMIIVMFVAACAVVNNDGTVCLDENKDNCEIYVPLYTPLKFFVISTIE